MCELEDEVVFNCRVGARIASVCASREWSAENGRFQYRFGRPQRLEIAVPFPSARPRESARAGVLSFSGGGGAYLRFPAGRHAYVVYTAISGRWGERAGVVVERDGRPLAAFDCRGPIESMIGPALFERGGFEEDAGGFLIPP